MSEKDKAAYLAVFRARPHEFMHVLTHDLREVLAGVKGAAFFLNLALQDHAEILSAELLDEVNEPLGIIEEMVVRGLMILEAASEYDEGRGNGS
ncbi:MAG: hypothetical protein JW910_10620 [Anaerolineae bacterium]|nr:hypothetical protein [Anaerolineae bacterium]